MDRKAVEVASAQNVLDGLMPFQTADDAANGRLMPLPYLAIFGTHLLGEGESADMLDDPRDECPDFFRGIYLSEPLADVCGGCDHMNSQKELEEVTKE